MTDYRQNSLDTAARDRIYHCNGQCAHTYSISRKHLLQFRRAIDVGCKVGNFTHELLRDFEQVEAFDMRNWLRWRLLDKERVNFHQVALGEENGQTDYWGASTGVVMTNKEKTTVDLRTLDSFNFTDVDYIKIDVEGDELAVLQGSTETLSRCKPLIVIEQNKVVEQTNKGLEFQALEWLTKNNYKIVDYDGMDDWVLTHV
jgi:FkbM family methyltransferase